MAAAALAGLAGLAVCACSGRPAPVPLSVLVSWSGSQLTAFDKVVAEFEKQDGIRVNVEGTRALTEELGADLQEGTPPDVAALPSLGAIVQYANDKQLQPLGSAGSFAAYGSPWSALMRPDGSRQVYAVPVKVDVKSLIWYSPAKFRELRIAAPANRTWTWTRLRSAAESVAADGHPPWCLAMASPPTSGWPGADWIADILLSQYGPRVYQEWVSGQLRWTSAKVRHSWRLWGELLGIPRAATTGPVGALSAPVGTVNPAVGSCYMQHGALVDEGFAKDLRFPGKYDFGRFPTGSAIQVSGDFIGVFATDKVRRQEAMALVDYLTGKQAQQEFVTAPGVDGFSANSQVPLSAYPRRGSPARAIAGLLWGRELCFSAADAMPPLLGARFHQAVLEYLADPAALPEILRDLKKVASPAALNVCGMATSVRGGRT